MVDAIVQWLASLKWDGWFLVSIVGQTIFFSRFMVQWIASERAGESVVPVSFWWLSIGGSVTLLVYAFARKDPGFILAYLFNCVPYTRNLMLIRKKARLAALAGAGRPA